MKCPLFTIMDKRTQLGEESDYCECLKEECAWWNGHNNECSFISIGKVLNAISTYLYEIKDKMPHSGQFTK